LAGFAKKDDLKYFLKAIGGIHDVSLPEPTRIDWKRNPASGTVART
jgi:hypothetical protein